MKPKSSLLPVITTAGIGIVSALLLIVVIENQRHLASAREEQASLELRINEALKSDSATSAEAGGAVASGVTFTNQISAQDIETIKLRYAKMNSITPQEREELNAKINQLKERMQGFTVDDVGNLWCRALSSRRI